MKFSQTLLGVGLLATEVLTLDLFLNDSLVCIEQGTHGWDLDGYFNSKTYQDKTASTKLDELWNKLTEVENPMCQVHGGMYEMFNGRLQRPARSQEDIGDEMAISDNGKRARKKFLHQQGVVAKAKFNIVDNALNYTGIFASGAEHVLVRLSEADITHSDYSHGANPSVAIKFLRSLVHSANQFGMHSFEGTNTWNFFENDLMSVLPDHNGSCGPQSVAKFNAQSGAQIFQTGSYDMALYKADGELETSPNYPFALRFKANSGLPVTDNSSPFYEQLSGSAIPIDTVLFEVYAIDVPTSWGNPAADTGVKIGEIVTTSEFQTSLWGDEKLFFQHGDFSLDVTNRWTDFRGAKRDITKFNSRTWGSWPDDFSIDEVDDATVYAGWANGCPFQYVIDALAAF